MSNILAPTQFWIFAAQAQLEKINNPFGLNLTNLREFVAQIRTYTINEEAGLYQVVNYLYQNGLTVIIQPQKHIHSAILFVNDKPCIVLSNPNQKYSELWFNLLHELYHILFEYENLSIQRYHLSYDGELLLSDNLADFFAEMILFDPKKLNFFYKYAYKEPEFNQQARDNYIHPAILVDLLLRNNPPARIKSALIQLNCYQFSSEQSLKAFFFPYWERFSPENS